MRRFLLIASTVFLTSSCGFLTLPNEGGQELSFSFEKIPFEGDFPTMTDFKFLPGTNDFLALNRAGKVGYFKMGGSKASLVSSFSIPGVTYDGDCGASSLQLDPSFAKNGFFYIGYCSSMQDNVVARFTFDPQYFPAVLLSQKDVITTAEARAVRPVHGVGSINFDEDGAMLVHFGEKGITTNAQDLQSHLGKIIRLFPSRDPDVGGYNVPSDNPFLGDPDVDPLVYAYGFRNPWRGVFLPSGRYAVADVGAAKTEEIDLLQPGENYGWPRFEGPCAAGCEGVTDPVLSYDHSESHPYVTEDPKATTSKFRTAWVCGGYDGKSSSSNPYGSSLGADLIFGDLFVGWVRGAAFADDGTVSENRLLGHLPFVTSCAQGKDGFLYFGTMFTATKVDQDGNPEFDDPSQLNASLWRMVQPSSPVDEIE